MSQLTSRCPWRSASWLAGDRQSGTRQQQWM